MTQIDPSRFTTRPELVGTFGVVASTHWIATAVGMVTLERGGNAFDAACAMAFVHQVVEPHLNGPAGDATIILHDARSGAAEVICGQGPAPEGLTIERCRSLGLDLVPGTGMLAACIPGAFDAWMLMLREHGTMTPAEVLGPAIGYARHGHPLAERASAAMGSVGDLFRTHWTTSADVYLVGGGVPVPGALFANPALADTYERIARDSESRPGGREARIDAARGCWSLGFVAEAVDRFCRTRDVLDVSGRRHRGVLSGHDMAGWRARTEAPVGIDYGRYRVLKAGPWSQGPVALQQLAILGGIGLDGLDPTGPDFIHLVVETSKLAFADREVFYGDPEFVDVPLDALLSKAYNSDRRALIGDRESPELRPGRVPGHGGGFVPRSGEGARDGAEALGAGEPTVGWSGAFWGDTVHFDVVDRHGNMVSATPSGGWLQSSPVIPELGFGLGTCAQMFWLDEGHPGCLKPGKRPRTTRSPGMALRDGLPYLAWGTPGGDQQEQWGPQFLLRHAHAGMNLQEAIDAPAWHSEHAPSSFWPREARPNRLVVEGRLPASTVAELRGRGHDVEVTGDWSEGRLTAAALDDPLMRAAANPRGMQAYAAGR